ncbi:histidine phosphatase superfamily [Mycena capillaripes]|nr:histidine phosphatase superfamily [Mycena capillaripes]
MSTTMKIVSFWACLLLSSCSTTWETSTTRKPDIQKLWGAYSPFFESGTYVPPPVGCHIDQVNLRLRTWSSMSPLTMTAATPWGVLPNVGAAVTIISGITKLQSVQHYTDARLDFLKTFTYFLGIADLGPSFEGGELAFDRYTTLINATNLPFVRASGSARVVDSANNWTAGFSAASHHVYKPNLSVIVSENGNDTLENSGCPKAGNSTAQKDAWLAVFAPNITARLNRWAPGANISNAESYSLISMCPIQTVGSFVPGGQLMLSPFCALFTDAEFAMFEYSMDLDKYYGTGYGAFLGRVQGVGYINELLARLTDKPVNDSTQTNITLTGNPSTMAAIYAAMGLFRQAAPLDPTLPGPRTWVASRLVPFSARMVVERLKCSRETQFVRVFVNDALQPLDFCAGSMKNLICEPEICAEWGRGRLGEGFCLKLRRCDISSALSKNAGLNPEPHWGTTSGLCQTRSNQLARAQKLIHPYPKWEYGSHISVRIKPSYYVVIKIQHNPSIIFRVQKLARTEPLNQYSNIMSAIQAFSFDTTAEEVATALSKEIAGKNVLVTGTSLNGLGFETARVIAKHANLVIITGYNDERLKLSEEALKKDVPGANIRRLILDLGSLAAIRKSAAEVNAYPEPLHVLIHNAAAAIGPFKLTVDGLESQIGTDHVGPFLLTKLLVPKLRAASSASYTPRVVFLSSHAHTFGAGVNFAKITHPTPEGYTGAGAYFEAKSANILAAIELSKRSKGAINAYSLHPGIIFTNINQKEDSIPEMQALGILGPDGLPNKEKFQWKTIAQGAATTIAAAFDPRINDKPGAYLDDSTIATETVAAHSSDPANAEKLWTITEGIIGEKFTF